MVLTDGLYGFESRAFLKRLAVVELSNDESMENRKVSWVDIVKKGESHK